MFFSQPSQISAIPDGVNRFYNKYSVYSQLTFVTDRQTDRRKISIAERLRYVTLANTLSSSDAPADVGDADFRAID